MISGMMTKVWTKRNPEPEPHRVVGEDVVDVERKREDETVGAPVGALVALTNRRNFRTNDRPASATGAPGSKKPLCPIQGRISSGRMKSGMHCEQMSDDRLPFHVGRAPAPDAPDAEDKDAGAVGERVIEARGSRARA